METERKENQREHLHFQPSLFKQGMSKLCVFVETSERVVGI
jgi:hypothetical protein